MLRPNYNAMCRKLREMKQEYMKQMITAVGSKTVQKKKNMP